MSNMSYCRFENTLADLRDCRDALADSNDPISELSDSERRCALELLVMCRDLAADFEWDIEAHEERKKAARAARMAEQTKEPPK